MPVCGALLALLRDRACLDDRFALGEPVDVGLVGAGAQFIAGPLHKQEGILYAEIDPQQMRGSKWMLDVAGHYGRPDVFRLERVE